MKPILTLTSIFYSLTLFAVAWSRPADGAERPNFVFVLTDDQRWDALSVVQREQGSKGRFPWLKTPNMDRLAAEGVRFRNAFVVNSLCSPARASFLTGKYGPQNGIVNNHTPLSLEIATYASLLRQSGYRTAYVGKWHMDGQVERPGFDFAASFAGQGKYFDCPIYVDGKQTPTEGWVDDVSTDYAIEFIRKNADRPFAIELGYKAAHGPFDPPPRRADEYEGQKARSVPNFGIPAIYRADTQRSKRWQPTDDGLVTTNINYFRCLTAADDNLGRVLDVLDELGLAENTMVVFAGDNGFYLGEHSLGDKRTAYEESMRIPLLVRYPAVAKADRVVDRMVLNTDLPNTILDYAGLNSPDGMQGLSWRPLLEEKPTDWRKAFFYCYFYERNFNSPMTTAVRTDTAKLIKYPGHEQWTELFDLTADPYEIENLYNDPAAASLKRQMEAEYEQQMAAADFTVPPFADDPTADRPASGRNAWVLDYRFDATPNGKASDRSGHHNDGKVSGAMLAEGRDGNAWQFDGAAVIAVPKTPSMNPAVDGWTIEVVFFADEPGGVLLAHGGQSNGYSLALVEGKPGLTVVSGNRDQRIVARRSVVGRWVELTAKITSDGQAVLSIDGKPAAEAKLNRRLKSEPNDALSIGTDLGSKVPGNDTLSGLHGRIESVRIFSGEAH